MADNFRSSDIALKVQKKIVSRLSTKGVAKIFIDDKMGSLLDNVYKLCRTYVSNFLNFLKVDNYNLIFVSVPK